VRVRAHACTCMGRHSTPGPTPSKAGTVLLRTVEDGHSTRRNKEGVAQKERAHGIKDLICLLARQQPQPGGGFEADGRGFLQGCVHVRVRVCMRACAPAFLSVQSQLSLSKEGWSPAKQPVPDVQCKSAPPPSLCRGPNTSLHARHSAHPHPPYEPMPIPCTTRGQESSTQICMQSKTPKLANLQHNQVRGQSTARTMAHPTPLPSL